jgi:hypothetical protein
MPSSPGDGSRCVDFLLVASCSQQGKHSKKWTILAVALLAVLPAVVRAVRIDPVTMLRSE